MTASSSTSVSAKPSKRPRGRRLLAAVAIALVAALVIAVAAVAAAVTTAPGRAVLVRIAEGALSSDGRTITIGRLGPGLPGTVQVTDIRVADADGEWLTIAGATVDWRPLGLLAGDLDVARIAVDEPVLSRLPTAGTSEPDGATIDLSAIAIAVRLESLTVENGRIGQPVLGQPIQWQASGGVTGTGDGVWQGGLVVERTDGVPATARVDGRFDALREQLDLDAALSVPPGGAIAGALGLPGSPAVSVSIAGQGTLSDWRGEVTAEATDVGRVFADLAIGRPAGAVRLSVAGRATVAAALPPRVAGLALDDIGYDATVQWDGADTVTVPAVTITTDTARLNLAGATDLARGTFDLAGTAEVDSWRDRTTTLGATAARITATGPWRAPTVDVAAQVQDLQIGDLGADAADITATLAPVGTVGDLDVRLNATIRRPRMPAPLPAVIGAEILASATGRIGSTVLEITRFAATGQHLGLNGNAELDLQTGALATAFEATMPTLEPLAGILPGSPAGGATLESFLQRSASAAPLTGTAALTVTAPTFGQPFLDSWLGEEIVIASDVVADLADGIELPTIDLASGQATIGAAVAITDNWSQIDARFALTGADLAAATPMLGVPVAGMLSANGQVTGALVDPDVQISATTPDLVVDAVAFSDLEAGIGLTTVASAPAGRIEVTGVGPVGAFDLATDIAAASDRITLSAITATAGATRATADLAIALPSGLLTGRATGRIGDLAPWAAIVGADVTGSADITASADATGGVQGLALGLSGQGVRVSGTTVAETLNITATGRAGVAEITAAATGPAANGFDVEAAATVRRQGTGVRTELTRLNGTLSGHPFALQDHAVATVAPGRVAIDQATMTVGGGTLALSGALTDDNVEATMRLAALPLDTVVAPLLPGTATDGELTVVAQLAGTLAEPLATVDLEVGGAAFADNPDIPPLDGSARVDWRDGRLNASGSITGIGEPLTFAAELPLQASAPSLVPLVPADGSLTGRVAWRGNVAEVWDWAPLPDHRLSGDLRVDLAVLGQVSSPRINGVARLAAGRYENLQTGTLLTDLEVTVEPPTTSGRAVAVSLSARDGASGTVTGQGVIDLTNAANPDMDLSVTLRNLVAVRRDEVTATVGGDLQLTPDRITGRLEVAPAEIRLIASSLPPSVVNLDVVDADAPAPPAANDAGAAPALDIRVDFPGRTFVRGRGLDSEWSGDIQVAGNTDAPVITGTLAAVRGDFTFAGTNFDVRESSISFDGAAQVDPILDITAEHTFDDATVLIRITGPTSAPVIALQSSPTLPQDEIIARILFGADVASLSPLQVAQIGLAVAQLSGAGAGTGILDRLREVIGVDRLSVNAGEQGGAEVTAGRYIGDAFVGVRQGTQPGTSAATVELEVLPNITVESEVNSTSGPKTGIFWKRDY